MTRGLLLYVMFVFAAALVVFIARFTAPANRRERLRRLMLGLMTLGLTAFGAESICAGTEPVIGWLLIASTPFGTLIAYIHEGRAPRADPR